MKKKALSTAIFITLLTAALTACGTQKDEAVSASVGTDTPQLQTEEDLRSALAALGEDPVSLEQAKEYYEELLARDAFEEEDYVALSRVYAGLGDKEGERRMLWKVYRLYPSEEYAVMVSDIVMEKDASQEETAELMNSLETALTEKNAAELRSLIASQKWKDVMQEDEGMLETKIKYADGESVVQIITDSLETEVTWLETAGDFLYYRVNEAGSLIADAVYRDNAFNGTAEVFYFDSEGNLFKQYRSTLRENLCVDSIAVDYDEVHYAGVLKDDGTTAEEQQEKVTNDGGVIYAYSTDGGSYLYQENTTVGEFSMDCIFLGIPYYETWE